MPYQELDGLGMAGLNQDTPAQALDHLPFSAGFNMRPFDGSLQQVFAFTNDLNDNIAPPNNNDTPRSIYGATQWTSSGEQSLNIAYAYEFNDDKDDLMIQIVEDVLSDDGMVGGAVAMTKLDPSSRFDFDIFAFNDIIVVNDGSNHPVWLSKDEGVYTAKLLPGWPIAAPGDTTEARDYFNIDELKTITLARWNQLLAVAVTTVPDIGERVTLVAGVTLTEAEQAVIGLPTTAEKFVAFENRLVAINISEEYIGSEAYGNTTLLWSTPITALGTLIGMEWVPSSTNTAGDDIITETYGEILDAVPLGQYLIVYKTDGVYRYIDSGNPLYLVGELLFSDDGLYSPGCAIDIGGGKHFVMGNYGVFIHDGGPNKQNVSRGRVERYLYSLIHQDRRDDTFLFHHVSDKEVWICFPGTWISDKQQYDGDASDNFDGPNDDGCNRALVYNYEQDTWYERALPVFINFANDRSHGLRGMVSTELNGGLYIFGFSRDGTRFLRSERPVPVIQDSTQTDYGNSQNGTLIGDYSEPGRVEFHYFSMGDDSKVKSIKALYPHTMEKCFVEVTGTNGLGAMSDPDFTPYFESDEFDSDRQYKYDTRVHGRYIHMALHGWTDISGQDVNTNPMITGMGMDATIGGDR